jgi:YD repeat-containing protein
MNRTIRALSALLVVVACALPLAAQQHPNVQKGFAPERAYQMAEVDNVNLFNGNLVVQIPIGQRFPVGGNLAYNLTLTYNAKLWDYQKVIRNFPVTGTYLRPIPSRRSNAGFGWLVSFGRILLPDNPINDGGLVVYESPDGSEHVIYSTLHEGEPRPPQTPGTNYVQGYTRDGTYLRMKSLANGDAEIEFPDGNVHLFREIGITGLMRPIELRDRYGNFLKIEYSTDNMKWTLTDNHNRKHYVDFESFSGQTQDNYKTGVGKITVTQFNGSQAIWDFRYRNQSISRACVPTGSTVDPQAPSSLSIPMLDSVDLPTNESWDFTYYSSHSACGMGSMQSMTTPTGARIDYDYQLYRLPAAGCKEEAFNESPGIRSRKITNRATNETATWFYDTDPQTNFSSTGWGCPSGTPRTYPYAPSEELKNTITKPNGDRVVNYFSIWPQRLASGGGFKRDDYGLPFTRRQTSGFERFLSSTLTGNGKTTSTYVKYERDGDPDFIEPLAPLNVDTNRRVAATKTVYDDGKFAEVTYSNFDGLGNYRTATTSGTFRDANTRTTTTTYNPSVGEYKVDSSGKAMPGYNPLGHGATWILNTYTSRSVSEGSSNLRSEFCFDGGTGFLRGRRINENGVSGGSNDVVVVYDHVSGNVTSEKYFGGDVSPTSSSGCAASGASKYEIVNTWQYGSLKTSKHNGMSYFDVDNDINLNTGLVSVSRDRAGISTTYTYDALGRLLTYTPQAGHGAATKYDYNTDNTSPTIDIVTTASGAQRDRKFLRFDSLGRLWAEFQLLPTGSWNAKVTRYDNMGRIARESQREAGNPFGGVPSPANWTYRTWDYLNRELVITPPDGDKHKIEYQYQGISQTNETVRVGDGSTERPVTVIREFDRQGRISQVTEPSGPTGGSVRTEYEYDAGDRLRKVTMHGEATQTRTFTYDGRGFMTQEKHPEFDGGVISYADFDALGHPGRKSGGGSGGSIVLPGQNPPSSDPFDLTFTYDAGERLTHVRNFGTLVKEFIYDTGAGFGKGKVGTAKRFQTVEGIGSVPVTETYTYSGVGGRVSKKATTVGTLGSFEQSYTYTDLGQELTITYPNCLHTGCKETSPSRTITNAYSGNNSWLTAVNGYAPVISYHTNAEVAEVQHANGVTDTQGLDANMIARPASITFSGYKLPPPCVKPVITTEPPASIGGPDKATFRISVVATGSEPLRYQWYKGTKGNINTPIAGATDASYVVTISAREQESYWVRVSNACGTVDSIATVVRVCSLNITSQPETKVVAKNDPASFSVTAANAQGTVTYQWYEGASGQIGKPVAGGTSATLTIAKAQVDASYWVRVKDSCAQVDSEAAQLIVGSPCLPVITKHPQSVTIIIPDFTTLRVEATTSTNDKNFTWQWYEGEKGDVSKPLGGAQAPSVSVRPSKSTKYWVRVAAKCGSVDSEAALVCVLPKVDIQPRALTVVPHGQAVTLSFQHGFAGDPVTYQWYEGVKGDISTPMSGETEKSLLVTGLFTAQYWARISNQCGFNDTEAAKICVLPNITRQPAATVRKAGENVTLSVQATGVGLTYQWYEGQAGDKTRPISNATQATVSVAPTATTKYWVAVTNECGTTPSLTAEVKYCEPPVATLHPVGGTLSPGQTITLKADFTGTDLTYRWYANGSPISFGTGKELFVSPQFSTSYVCEATNGCGTVRTQPAHVGVCGPPVILQQPAANTYVPPNTAGTLSVVVGGGGGTYQWYEGVTGDKSKPVPNGNGSAITVGSRTTSYWVHISSGCGETSSITAHVKACGAPTFLATSSSYFITLGQQITLSVKNLTNGPASIQWYEGVPGDTSRFVGGGESAQVQPQKTTSYWVRVTNGCTTIDSNVGKIDVCVPPRILQNPIRETTITWRESAVLTATAIGSWAQWTWYEGTYTGTKKEVGIGLLNGTGAISVTVKPDVDKQYYLNVRNQCGGDSTSVAIVWVRNCGVPTIARQPESVNIDVGRQAFLYVAASSASRYQWYLGDSGDESKPIPGANFSSIVVAPGATTRYWVKASNHCGDVNSSTVTVGVRGTCVPPVITQQPYFATTRPGTPVQLSIEALAGSANATYQWYTQDGQAVPGATSATVTVSPAVNTSYYAVVTNACGSDTSQSTSVTVTSTCVAPTITEQPQETSMSVISPATLAVRASGTWPLTYQWYHDTGSGLIAGATSRTYQVPISSWSHQPSTYHLYHVTVKNACGEASSYSTKVQPNPSCAPPKFTLQPRSATIDPGKSAVLSVAAEGGAAINFDWYTLDGQKVPNTFGSTESTTVSPTRTTSYYIVARGSCGFATSDVATITVNAPCSTPIVTDHPRSSTIVRGNPVTLSATASGTTPITWQWFNGDGSPIQGATSASYTVTPERSASFYAIASNACGTVQTNFALVTVACDQPIVTQQPQGVTIERGQPATLTAVVNQGSLPATYQWYMSDGTPVAGQTASTMTITPSATTIYYLEAKNLCGTTRSQNVAVVICEPPVITAQPQDVTVNVGKIFSLSVAATGTGLRYQWFTGSGAPLGQFSFDSSYSAGIVDPTPRTLQYYVEVKGTCGTTQRSRTATVTVNCPMPAFTQQPQSTTIVQGQSTTLSAGFTTGELSYSVAWYTAAGTKVGEGNSVTVSPQSTTSYYVEVRNACGPTRSNTVTVTVEPCPKPVITQQPQNTTYTAGQPVTLNVAATSPYGPLTYQWYNAGNLIAGATSASYTATNPTFTTTYYVVITNACNNSIQSNTVTVCSVPTIAVQPQDVTVDVGQVVNLSVTPDGSAPFTYRWFTGSGAPLNSFDASRSFVFVEPPPGPVTYYVEVTNACGTVRSRTVTVTVNCPKPSIVQQPQSATIIPGQFANLSVTYNTGTASGVGWYTSAGVKVGEGQSFFFQPSATNSYYGVITNACGSTTTATVTITVNATCTAPAITAQPQSVTINAGQQATLSVTASSSTSVTYQWYTSNAAPVPGGTSASLVVSPTTSTAYYVIVTNACGSTTSNVATVTVNTTCNKPQITAQPQNTTVQVNQSTTLSVTATSATPVTYQWYTSQGLPVAGGTSAALTVTPPQTTSYYVVITNSCGSTQSNTVTVTVTSCAVPVITSQPQSVSINAGQSATLSVTASGSGLTYQWFTTNNAPVSGGTSPTLVVSPAASTSYFVVVTNSCGSVSSNIVTVTVGCPVPAITSQPQSVSVTAGQSATLSVTASSGTPLTYQWFTTNNVPVSGGTSPMLVVSPASSTSYFVVVTNSCGSASSNIVTVTVGTCAAPAITSQPQSVSIAAGQSATLSVTASGSGLTYQWFNGSGTPLSGATSSTLTVSPAVTTSYYVVVTNGCGSTQSSTATVSITACTKPAITSQPQSTTITTGESVTLSVTVSNATGVTYQWFTSGGSPVGSSRTLTVAPAETTSYYVVATNSCGSTTSQTATVTVDNCTKVFITLQPQDVTIQPGGSATLSVSAAGDDPITYEWFLSTGGRASNGSSITVSPDSTTTYYCVVSNPCQIITTRFVTVTVDCDAPTITSNPQSATINEGQHVTLTVSATGTGPLSYEWQELSGSRWVGVGTGTSINVGGLPGTYTYRAVVSNSCGQDISAEATVTVNAVCVPPQITQNPEDPNFTEPWHSATISVAATGTNVTYRWYRDGMEIGSGPSITIHAQMTTFTYYAVASNSCGSDTSASIVVESICKPPEVTIVYATDPVVSPGGSSVLGVNSSGTPFLNWTLMEQPVGGSAHAISSGRGSNVPNATVIPPSTADYWYEVTNDCGSTSSNVVRITVQ